MKTFIVDVPNNVVRSNGNIIQLSDRLNSRLYDQEMVIKELTAKYGYVSVKFEWGADIEGGESPCGCAWDPTRFNYEGDLIDWSQTSYAKFYSLLKS